MPSLEILGIYALLVLNLILSVILVREGAVRILLAIQELDTNLATALEQATQKIPMQIEGQDAIPLAIAQWIGAQAQARSSMIDATVTPIKGEGGLFMKKEDNL